MRYAVLGTGMVGRAIGSKLVELGHEVRMGSRRAGGEAASAWAAEAGERASEGSFPDAAAFGERIVNATAGVHSVEALQAAGQENLGTKLLVDVANPIRPDSGMPPVLDFCNTESLGERIQAACPASRVVKTLNTMNASVMVDPSRVPGEHHVFVCGEDAAAKAEVTDLLADFGWRRDRVVDLGGISAARGTEMYLALWLRLWGVVGGPDFNVGVMQA